MDTGNEMIQIYSRYSILVDLIKLREEDSRMTSTMKDQIMVLEQGLQFLVIYMEILILFNYEGVYKEKINLNFDAINRIRGILQKKGTQEIGVLAMEKGEFEDWDTVASELLVEIESYKSLIREDCVCFSDGVYNGYWFNNNFMLKFMNYIDISMATVLSLKGEIMIPDEKTKFESIKEKTNMFRIVFNYVIENNTAKKSDFNAALNSWVCNVGFLCLFYWVLDENMATDEDNLILSKIYKMFDVPCQKVVDYCLNHIKNSEIPIEEHCRVGEVVSPDVTKMCLSYLKASKPSPEKRLEAFEIVLGFIECLHWNLKAYLPKDVVEMVRDAMLFLIAFVMDPPSEPVKEGQLVLSKTQEVLKEAGALIISLGLGEMDEHVTAQVTNFLVHDFLEKVIRIKVDVRRIYSLTFLDPYFNFPRFNVIDLIDSSVRNLQEFPSSFPKHSVLTFEKELIVLRDLLKPSNLKDGFVVKLQNEQIGLKDIWTRIANVAHQVDIIMRSNTYEDGLGLHTLTILEVQEEIRHLLPKIKNIKEQHEKDTNTCRTHEISLNDNVTLKFDETEMDEVVVGFEDKVREIRDWLTCGSEKLDIISIIGMGGLGKTTLAMKVYNDTFVKRYFTTCAWCTISQSYGIKRILLDILQDVIEVRDSFKEMEEEDLADKLRKCLKGNRYLIVLDDIWDVDVWNALKLSFPDDENYSRIVFTSRIQNIGLASKSDSYLYTLSQLSDQESWELLERKLFSGKGRCPIDFVQNGQQISRNCRGLPLVVVLVAGLLKKEIDNLDSWKDIEESLDSKISNEGCAHVLELSYKHLSEPLKACFLYLGLFPEDKVIKVQKLVNLWISEGFIQKKNMKDVEIVAEEYVMDLVGRSLLIVSNKSSSGGIKTCRIHDLLREFCLEKSKEEHFFKLLHGKNVSSDNMDENYRVSIESQHWKNFHVRKSSPLVSICICPTSTLNELTLNPKSFLNARFLYVLDLEDVKFIGDFPEEITTLIFLRYLAIWCTTKFIPATILRLEKLETLRIITKETFVLPVEILRMESLKHVHIGKCFTYLLFGSILPMKNILSFSTPCINYGKEAETFLRKLQTIHKLKCQFGSYDPFHLVIKLDFMYRLESLNLIHGEKKNFSHFMFSLPQNIKKLTLTNFGLPWREISKLAELKNLEVLKLLVRSFRGDVWNMNSEMVFRKLKFLKLQNLNVQKWSASMENFPSLEQIVVEHCYFLEEIPTEFGEISTLWNIQIRRCRSSIVKSAKEIEDQQIELGALNFKLQVSQILTGKLFD